jgi:ParB family chromosome partitioning protein
VATKRLGRGINALIRETTDESVQTNPIFHVPLKLVSPNPHQPRQKFDEKSLRNWLNPYVKRVSYSPSPCGPWDKGYELIAGERRLRAAKLAGPHGSAGSCFGDRRRC